MLYEEAAENLTVQARHFSNGSRITFTPEGTVDDTGAPGTFVLCDDRGNSAAAIVTSVGLVRDARDSNDSGVVENARGEDVSC